TTPKSLGFIRPQKVSKIADVLQWVLGIAVSMTVGLVVGAGIHGLIRGAFEGPNAPLQPSLPIVIGALLIGIATVGGILGTGASLIVRHWQWESS
ncbi:MAG: hypothetical protein O2783_01890, partial [Chloroflexi bacterium]|nr:hypothetical protein [Chloroflexota bacterium]